MKTVPHFEKAVAQDAIARPSPVKVCMHFLSTARTDYRVMRDASALIEAGYDVSIVDVEGDCTRPSEEDVNGIHMKHIIMPSLFTYTRFKPWFLIKLAWVIIQGAVRLLRIPANIYHAHVERALPACCIAALFYRKPLIFDAPELPLNEPKFTRWRRLSALATYVLARILPRCAGVITVSPPIVEEIRQRYRVPEVTLIRNVPAYRVVQKSDRLRQYLGLGPEVRIALYQGYLQRDRSLDLLIRAAPFLERDIVIVMMGKGVEPTKSQLEALIASEGVASRVKIIPPVPHEDLLDWTASADVGLIVYTPGYSLNVRMMLPNKLFEYLMAGLPVLASQLDATAEIIRTYDVGLIVSSLAPADVGAAINTMLADRAGLARMSRNGLAVAQQEFNWEKERVHLIQLYQDILSSSRFIPI